MSCTGVPIATGPGGTNSVAIDGAFGLTTRVSVVHTLVAARLLASPEYTACQKNVPAVVNVTGSESGTTPR